MNSSRNSELFEFISFMVEDEKTLLLQPPAKQMAAMAALIILSIIWSNIIKIFIYHSMAQEKLADRPINVLILVDQVKFFLIGLIDFSQNKADLLRLTINFKL